MAWSESARRVIVAINNSAKIRQLRLIADAKQN
jgi:hypothetical protein